MTILIVPTLKETNSQTDHHLLNSSPETYVFGNKSTKYQSVRPVLSFSRLHFLNADRSTNLDRLRLSSPDSDGEQRSHTEPTEMSCASRSHTGLSKATDDTGKPVLPHILTRITALFPSRFNPVDADFNRDLQIGISCASACVNLNNIDQPVPRRSHILSRSHVWVHKNWYLEEILINCDGTQAGPTPNQLRKPLKRCSSDIIFRLRLNLTSNRTWISIRNIKILHCALRQNKPQTY